MLGFNGGLMGVQRTPKNDATSGLWFQNEQSVAKRAGIWYGDPNFSSVSLLLHMDGSNGSTTFTDSSSNALAMTAVGNAQISTAQSKFGGSSGLFDGSGDYLTCSTSGGQFNFGSNNLTVEAWVRAANVSGVKSICGIWPTNNTGSWRFLLVDSGVQFLWQATDFTQDGVGTGSVITANIWHHVAAVRTGTASLIYVDGVLSGFKSITKTINSAQGSLQVGRNEDSNTWFMNGYIDDLRITKDIARYTGNFTPPTAAFPNG
jgi:hypothetical protein